MTRASRETAWRSGARIAVGAVAAVVVLLFAVLMSIPAKAVSVVVTPTPASIVRGGSVTFNVSVAIASGERIPINGVSLKLYSDSSRATHLTGSPYLSPRAMSFVSGTPSTGRGYGYGYGYDSGEGQGYYFFRGYGYMGPGLGYGYGSGYGYGYGGGVTLVYRVTIDTSASWAVGTYYVKVEVDSGTHSFDATSSFAVTEPVFGGGGGGGIVTTTTPTTTPTTTTTTTPTPTPTPTTTVKPTPTPTPTTTVKPTPTPTPTTTVKPTPTPTTTTTKPATTTTAPPAAVTVQLGNKIGTTGDNKGKMLEPVSVATPGGEVRLTLPKDTVALAQDGSPLTQVTVNPVATAPSAPAIVGGAPLVVIGLPFDLGPDGATFNPPIPVTLPVDFGKLPPGVKPEQVAVAWLDVKTNTWVELKNIKLDIAGGKVTGDAEHFTKFAVIVRTAAVAGAFNIWLVLAPVLALVVIGGVVYAILRRRRSAAP